jgi:hypothetical protein
MTRTRLEILQWFALFAGALAFTGNVVFGYGLTEAACEPSGAHWGGIDMTPWQVLTTALTAGTAVLAGLAALVVFIALRDVDQDAPGPTGRLRFFAMAALLANILFVAATLMQGVGAIVHAPCGQS